MRRVGDPWQHARLMRASHAYANFGVAAAAIFGSENISTAVGFGWTSDGTRHNYCHSQAKVQKRLVALRPEISMLRRVRKTPYRNLTNIELRGTGGTRGGYLF